MESDPKSRGLGRGLNALFEDDEVLYADAIEPEDVPITSSSRRDVLGVEQLQPGKLQPRQDFDEEALSELADSIREHGVLQPLVVRPDPSNDDRYEIIAGERRWRAAQKAQLHEVPVVIHTLSDDEALEIALIENLQREDLNPVEEALGYKRLIDAFDHSQEQVAKKLGKSRSHIANMVRLLNLPAAVLVHLRDGNLTMGHARALVTSKIPEEHAKEVIARGLSVRETEELMSGAKESADEEPPVERSGINPGAYSYTQKPSPKAKSGKDVDTMALEENLSNTLGMKVRILTGKSGKGSIKVEYKSLDQLDELIAKLKADSGSGTGRLSE